jgi:hypothetical protein
MVCTVLRVKDVSAQVGGGSQCRDLTSISLWYGLGNCMKSTNLRTNVGLL